ncbi:MAG: fasciclin domain-containing protein [Chloroflexi bacterium]|nr:MAG: fasciclin domain-containing protein [Chloroflexota bacterium]
MANIFETARAKHAYNKYLKGLESVEGLIETLSGPGPFTIFIPTDAAIDRLSDDQQADLFADPGKLAKVLKYHIVPGYFTADDLLDRLFLKTLEGQRLRVWSDISEVPLGEEESDIDGDALSYISRDTDQDQRWSCHRGQRDRGQWHPARHRQGTRSAIHYALKPRSAPFVPGCAARPRPAYYPERTIRRDFSSSERSWGRIEAAGSRTCWSG